ncbi:MAG: YfiR family protein [Salinivirgaceae bacterium]
MKKLIVILLVLTGVATMQTKANEIAKYKSLFTLNFIRYIGWPDESKQGDFVIGVIQNKELAAELRTQTEGKKFGFQNLVVKEFASVEEVSNCQIIYVSEKVNYAKNAGLLEQKVGKNTLIVSENSNAIANGSMINFVIVNEMLKFQVSPTNFQNKGLTVSNSLISMKNAIRM